MEVKISGYGDSVLADGAFRGRKNNYRRTFFSDAPQAKGKCHFSGW